MTGSAHRAPRWIVERLDREDNVLGTMPGWLPSSSFDIAATERLGGGLTLNLTDVDGGIDFLSDRVRVSYDPGDGSGAYPWGVWLLTTPKVNRTATHTGLTVACTTKLAVLDADGLTEALSLPAGTEVVPTVVDLIKSAGETAIAATDLGRTLSAPVTFDPGESKLTVINTLLSECSDYWALWVNRAGVFQISPWIPPAERGIVRTFEAGAASIHYPTWSREQDLGSIPNRVVVSTRGTDEEPALVGVAVNQSDGPFSVDGRGRVIQKSYEVEAASQSAVDALAAQYLQTGASKVLKVEATHAVVPLEQNDVVRFAPSNATPENYTVQRMAVSSLAFDAHISATWRGVNLDESGPTQDDIS